MLAENNNSRLEIGGNFPPDPIEILIAQLVETHSDLRRRCDDLLGIEGRLPAVMDDEWEGKITEAIKSCTKFVRNSEVTRLDANEPHRALIAATDGYFKKMSDAVDALKGRMTKDYLTPYQQKKADEEKRRREEAARQAAARAAEEEAARRAEAARVAEAKRVEEAARKAAAEAAAEVERKAHEAARVAKREADRIEAERVAAVRAQAEATNKAERDAAAALAAEAKRQADEAAAETKRLADEAKAESDRAAREAQAVIDKAKADRVEQQRVADEARDRAAKAVQERNTTSKASKVNAAERSRTRTDLGAVASLRTTWTHEVIDPQAVPRDYLEVNATAISLAIKAATVDNKCSLTIPGVRIYPVTGSVVR